MKWLKAPQDLKDLLEDAMKHVQCEKRPMFGYPAYFINKNMFIGLFQDKVFLRLSDGQLASLRTRFPSVSNLEPMPGRPMKNYYTIPRELYTNARAFQKVIHDSAEYTSSLSPKEKKSRKK